jgi:hypothetical protein
VNDQSPVEIGDRVTSILPGTDAVGIVVELLPGLFEEDVAYVHWTAGKSLVGRQTLRAVSSLRKLA